MIGVHYDALAPFLNLDAEDLSLGSSGILLGRRIKMSPKFCFRQHSPAILVERYLSKGMPLGGRRELT